MKNKENKVVSSLKIDIDFLFKKILIFITMLLKFFVVVFLAKFVVFVIGGFMAGIGNIFTVDFFKLIYYFVDFVEKIPFSEFFIGENFFKNRDVVGDDSLKIFMYFSSVFFIVSFLIKKIIFFIKKSFFKNKSDQGTGALPNIDESVKKRFFTSFYVISFIFWLEVIYYTAFKSTVTAPADILVFLFFTLLFFLAMSVFIILYYILDYFSQCINNSLGNAQLRFFNNSNKKDYILFFIYSGIILVLFKFAITIVAILIFIGYYYLCFGNMWKKLKIKNPKGIMILAPMADVTDNPFRKIIEEAGRPDLFYTEFVAVNGLAHKDAKERLESQILNFEKKQKPIVAQIFGGSSENFYEASKICFEKNFSGIDINMGCPQKNIIAQGSGAALMKEENREQVREIFSEVKRGFQGGPVSIKTRIGFSKIDLEWIKFVLRLKPDALIVHLRTQKEMSKPEAHWELMDEIKNFRDDISPETILIGNGDVKNLEDAFKKVEKYKIDGIMIGRGIFENPWLFSGKDFEEFSIKEKLDLVLKHTKYFEEEFGFTKENEKYKFKRGKNFNLLKKFFKIYVRGFSGAKELRIELMNAKDEKDVSEMVKKFLEGL